MVGLSFSDACDTSITANFVSGNFLATVFTASAMRKPTPITRSYFCCASVERFGT